MTKQDIINQVQTKAYYKIKKYVLYPVNDIVVNKYGNISLYNEVSSSTEEKIYNQVWRQVGVKIMGQVKNHNYD